ncbi:MAG: peptidoglycan editing factor PgeF [Muribaculaceae bacterium]|nr:peptidoglycan editing factor PgeF [Muribaculaceae bacterium]MBR0023648.1 peptidoglycan editing factor PgeF [Muribaculaceae bacterium]
MNLDKLILKASHNIEAFSTQRGEVTRNDNYSQWNLCDYTGDDAMRVLDARMTLCQQLDIDLDHLIMPRQTHSTNVRVIDQSFMNASIEAQDEMLEGVDALVCSLPSVCIGVNTADCVPIVLADSRHGIIAVAHAGWRGTVGQIAKKTVEMMCQLGANASDIIVAMGPSICGDCFEVGDEVVKEFEQAGFDISSIMHRNATTGKAHINLQEANHQVLIAAGIKQENITLPAHCSRCESDSYFSARRLGINSGRTFTGILMHN